MTLDFTHDQQTAIQTHDRNLIVVAGAGSGKTRVLVERYLALLARYEDWTLDALVAVTFTRKAAGEMRDRVRRELQARAASADGNGRWAVLLRTMDSARIDTIHALCATILRANAAEAGVDPRFGILEPTDAETLLGDVIDRVLNALTAGDEDDPAAMLFTHYSTDDIKDVLARYATAELPDLPDDVLGAWRAAWEQHRERLLAAAGATSDFREALRWAQETEFPAGDTLTDQWDAAQAALQRFVAYPDETTTDDALNAVAVLCDCFNLSAGSKKAWGEDGKEEAKNIARLARGWARDLRGQIGEPPGEVDERAAELLPLWDTLIRRVQAEYAARKAADDSMDFDDLERQTADLLANNPAVRARYAGAAFKHVLVDEFQDTNVRQWAIIRALTDPAAESDPARLFVVGDPKQSIYGFRGADVAVFDEVRETITDLAPDDDPPGDVPLVRSFRTHAPLIDAFNQVFGRLLQRDPDSLIGAYAVEYGVPMDAHRDDPPNDAPPLEIMLIDQEQTPPEAWDTDREDLNAPLARRLEAEALAERVRALVESGRTVQDPETGETRPARYDDIAFLFQTTTNIRLYEDALREAGISYVAFAGRGYYSRQEVWDVLALLRALHTPDDNLSLATALRSPLFNLSDEALFALRSGRDGQPDSLWAALMQAAENGHALLPDEQRVRMIFAADVLRDLRRLSGRVTISELLQQAMARTGYLAAVAGLPDGDRRRANVEKLLRTAAESGRVTPGAFTRYLGEMSEREVRESEAETDLTDAVTLMTVHASKGLEFPVVVLPDASWTNSFRGGTVLAHPEMGLACKVPGGPDDDKSWLTPTAYEQIKQFESEKETAERKRLLYVAMTRARDMVIVSGYGEYKDAGWTARGGFGWLGWLMDALEVRERAEPGVVDYAWGAVRLHLPDEPSAANAAADVASLWERGYTPDDALSDAPPLTGAVRVARERVARHLKATDIADLGSSNYDDYYKLRLQRSLTAGGAARVNPVVLGAGRKVSARVMGQVVHKALQWWRFPTDEDDMTALLASYAWREGVVDPVAQRYVVDTARGWLRDIQHTRVYRQIEGAVRVYRELPFIYRTADRTIHGVIDVLFQDSDGTWGIVDYKSSMVPGYRNYDQKDRWARANKRLVRQHARRYHLQVGVYAAAVLGYLARRGEPVEPETLAIYMHYLRYQQTVIVRHKQWWGALDALEAQIDGLIESLDLT